jgi:ketosteroid isomerase-like protein
MTEPRVTDEEVAELALLMAEGASAFIRGDIRTYATLMRHADDSRSWRHRAASRAVGSTTRTRTWTPSQATSGAVRRSSRVFQTYASGNLAVLVAIERQHGVIGDVPEQDLSIRVTLVFRRDGEWRLVHRHADPLVREISEPQLTALLRGDANTAP